MNNKIVKVELAGGGSIIVEQNPDPDYDGVSVLYETENGGIVSIVCIECKAENNYEKFYIFDYLCIAGHLLLQHIGRRSALGGCRDIL